MKAVVYKGPMKVTVEEVEDPKIEAPTDAIVRMTSTAICGSDLHMYEGHTAADPGMVFGHEPMGVVEEVGEAVQSVKKGDRVVMPFNVFCGYCYNCLRGFYSACLTMNQETAGAAYGYVKMGPYRGGQAEYLRVPMADVATTKLPGKPGDDFEEDFVLLADVLPTAFHACMLAMVIPGSPVAIFGAGPIGLGAVHCSHDLLGAAQIFSVDKSKVRLAKAEEFGAIPIDFTKGDPVAQIFAMRAKNKNLLQSLKPGEEKMAGVMCGIDAVGYEAFDRENPKQKKTSQVIEDLVRVVNPTGHLGIIGVYLTPDPQGEDELAKQGKFVFPYAQLWEKGLMMGTGQAPVKSYINMLRDLIIAGRAKPSKMISHRASLADAPDLYREFMERDRVVKAVLKP